MRGETGKVPQQETEKVSEEREVDVEGAEEAGETCEEDDQKERDTAEHRVESELWSLFQVQVFKEQDYETQDWRVRSVDQAERRLQLQSDRFRRSTAEARDVQRSDYPAV